MPLANAWVSKCPEVRGNISCGLSMVEVQQSAKVVTWMTKELTESFRPLPIVTGLIGDVLRSRQELVAENMMLGQQLIVASRKVKGSVIDG